MAGADASFDDDRAIGAVVIMKIPGFEVVESAAVERRLNFPYIPTLLTFREGPVLLECFRVLKSEPDLIIFDGQGIAHPRGMGLAAHLGVLTGKPSIGCAKSKLYGDYKEPGGMKGDFSYLKDKSGKRIGAVLRTRSGVKPVFVSPGHMINIEDSVKTVLKCCDKYRIPEPVRFSHSLANKKRLTAGAR